MKFYQRTIFLYLILTLIAFYSCSGGEKVKEETPEQISVAAADYFEQVMKPIKSVLHSHTRIDRSIMSDMRLQRPSGINRAMDKLENSLEELQKQTTAAADKIAALPGFRGDKTFRNAVLDYIEFLETYAYDQVVDYIRMNRDFAYRYNEISQDEIDEINRFIDKMNKDSETEGKKFESAQSVFAKKYKFRLLPSLPRI